MSQLQQSRVLITGSSGFLGRHLSRRLLSDTCEVHAASRAQRTSRPGDLIWWQVDPEDLSAVRDLVSTVKPDIIFHLSGLASAAQSIEFVLPTFHSQVTSTVNVLTASAEVGCSRVVLTGSVNEPVLEGVPTSPYGAAKWAGRVYGRMFHALYQTPVVIVRPYMAYGPEQSAGKLIPYVILSLLEGRPPKLSNGRWEADWIYVEDVIEGFVAAALVPDIEGSTFDLGSGVLVSVRDVVMRVVELMGTDIAPKFGERPDRVLEPPAREADTTDAFEKLGWRSKVSLEEGLRRTVKWFKAQHLAVPGLGRYE